MGEGQLGRSKSQCKVPGGDVFLVCFRSGTEAVCLGWREQEAEWWRAGHKGKGAQTTWGLPEHHRNFGFPPSALGSPGRVLSKRVPY